MATSRAKTALGVAAAAGLSLIAFTSTYLTMPWESKRNAAYWDSLGQVWTACYGETKNIHQGDKFTDAQCLQMLNTRMEKDYHRPLQACMANFNSQPFSVQASFLDLAWNVGTQAVCGSSAAKFARLGQWSNACQAMTLYNRAAGKVVRGLDLRRKNGDAIRIGENEICTAGLK